MIKSWILDALAVVGLALTAAGVYQIYAPAAWIVTGLTLLGAAILGATKWRS